MTTSTLRINKPIVNRPKMYPVMPTGPSSGTIPAPAKEVIRTDKVANKITKASKRINPTKFSLGVTIPDAILKGFGSWIIRTRPANASEEERR